MTAGFESEDSKNVILPAFVVVGVRVPLVAVGNSAGGVTPIGAGAINYLQALLPNYNRHRMSFGVGIRDLLPGLDFDLFAGGMFENTDRFAGTIASIESYWVGAGLTWRFGRGASECLHIPDEW